MNFNFSQSSIRCGKFCFVALILFIVIISIYNNAYSYSPSDLDSLIKKAEKKDLDKKKYWHTLLHYKKGLFGYISRIDDEKFFLSKKGKTDPKKELIENINKFFSNNDEKNKEYICRFYARYKWLKKELDPQNKLFKEHYCEEIEKITPGIVSVIFPSYYMNNPASMFGHTLITINTEYNNKRLSDAVNYAAQTNTNNGVNFAIRGIFGFFKGYYSVMPYYKKIQQYSDINQRDIWEYRLNLEKEEVRRMIWHITELESIYADYYFFHENCSFNLLYLIEVARPEVNLVNRFKTVVIPIDTVKYMKEENLIVSADFRPSKTTEIKSKLNNIKGEHKKTINLLVNGNLSNKDFLNSDLSKTEKIKISELASDIIQYRYINEEISKKEYKKTFFKTLKLRSKLGKKSNELEYNIITPPRPDLGHNSNRISYSQGISHGDLFSELRFRPAFTDLTDVDYINSKGAQIEFLDTRLRYFYKSKELKLNNLDLIDIKSISPRDDIFKPISWKINVGISEKLNHEYKEANVLRLNTGGGYAYKPFKLPMIFYSFSEFNAEAGGTLKDNYGIGIGASAGILGSINKKSKFNISSTFLRFGPNDYYSDINTKLKINYKVSKNNHISIDYIYKNIRKEINNEFALSWHHFF